MSFFPDQQVGATFSFVYSGSLGTEQTRLLLLNGTVQSLTVTYVALSDNLWKISFTPQSTGRYDLVLNSAVAVTVDVVSVTIRSMTQDILDESLGTWAWDKQSGQLTLYRQNGTAFKTFTMADSLTEASRT